MADEGPLACPRCARRFALSERFCPDCEMPLVYAGRGDERPITEIHERARKIDPRYTGGRLVRVATAGNQAEGEFIQGLLLEQGIPSMQRRSAGFDVPDFLAAGPRDILVNEAGLEAAREMLQRADVEHATGVNPALNTTSPVRLALWILTIAIVATGLIYLLYLATG